MGQRRVANDREAKYKQACKDKIECNTSGKMESWIGFREHFGKLGNSVFGKRRFARNGKDMRMYKDYGAWIYHFCVVVCRIL